MCLFRWALGVAMALMLVTAGSNRSVAAENAATENAGQAAAAQKGNEAVFKLRPVPVLAQADRFDSMPNPMIGGSTVMVSSNRFKEIRAYPQLNSKRPLYGELLLNGDATKRASAKKFYFVLDESAPRAEAVEKADKSAQGKAGKTAEKPGGGLTQALGGGADEGLAAGGNAAGDGGLFGKLDGRVAGRRDHDMVGQDAAADGQRDGDRRPGDRGHLVQRPQQAHRPGIAILPGIQLATEEPPVVVIDGRKPGMGFFHPGQELLPGIAAQERPEAGP